MKIASQSKIAAACKLALAALSLSLVMPAAQAADPGITDTEVHLGGTCPTSGPLASFGTICAMEEAYFNYVNEKFGGVKMGDGKTRKIKYTWLNDEYSPPRALEQVRRLIDRERVFALFGVLGTAPNMAVRDQVNRAQVPHLYVGTGASIFSTDQERYPWTMGWQINYITEALIYADWVKRNKPNATVAVLFQNDDFGKELMAAFKEGVKGSNVKIVSEASYEVTSPTIDAQVISLANSKADVFLNFSIPRFAAQAVRKMHEIQWKPTHIMVQIAASIKGVFEPAGLDASQGIMTGLYVMDQGNPAYKDDPAIKLFNEVGSKYGSKTVNLNEPMSMVGFVTAQQMVHTLSLTKSPTRAALMTAARNQCDVKLAGLLPDVKVCVSGKKDPFSIESLQMMQFKGKQWEAQGATITSFEGKTPTSAGGK